MISDHKRDISVDTNVTVQGTSMSLDAEATEHLIGLLTDLYSDPEQAVIREYATNALDANRAAGNHAPIEVTLPTELSPFLRIKDEGIGLTVEELHTVYALYGKSTKRDSNEQVGMLGLGCKSALTYTDQFTLVARKDGVQATASISRGENGVGVLTVLDTTSTTERNGVEVVIPVKRHSAIPRKAREFFRFWKPGTVLVNGEPPVPYTGLQVTEDIIITDDADDDYIVMGNVPYPATITSDLGYNQNLGYGLSAIVTVPIGAVHFTPSREALHETSKTKAVLERIKQTIRESLKGAVERHVQSQPTRASAMREVVKWNGQLPSTYKMMDLKYQGVDLPTQFKLKDDQKFVTTHINSHRMSAHSNTSTLYAAAFPTTAFLTGYDRTSFTAGQKKKLVKWAEQQGIENLISGFALLPDGVPAEYVEFIPPEHIGKWSDVQAIKLPRNPVSPRGSSGRIPGSYDMWVDGTWKEGVPASDIDTSEPIYWVKGGSYGHGVRVAEYLAKNHDAFTLLPLSANRVDKFLRNFPMAQDPYKQIRADHEAWLKTITDADKRALGLKQYGDLRRALEMLQKYVSQIKDPEIVAAIRALSHDTTKIEQREREFMNLIYTSYVERADVANPLARYTLLPSSYYMDRKMTEILVYINASYEAREARKAVKAAKAAS